MENKKQQQTHQTQQASKNKLSEFQKQSFKRMDELKKDSLLGNKIVNK